jgi:hypothetical protein
MSWLPGTAHHGTGEPVERQPSGGEVVARAVEGEVAEMEQEVRLRVGDMADDGVPVLTGLGASGDRWDSDTTQTRTAAIGPDRTCGSSGPGLPGVHSLPTSCAGQAAARP